MAQPPSAVQAAKHSRGRLCYMRIALALVAVVVAAGCCHPAGPGNPSATRPSTEAAAQPGSLIFPNELADGHRPRSIAFVCDASGSMAPKMWSLKRELRKAILALHPDQQFSITIFQDDKPAMLSPGLLPATVENKYRAEVFLLGVRTTGDTDPIPGLRLAMAQHPQMMYLLTNADFPDDNLFLHEVGQLDPHHTVQISTIGFVDDNDRNGDFFMMLKILADDSGGTFKKVEVEPRDESSSNISVVDGSLKNVEREARDESNHISVAYVCDAGESMAPKLACLKRELSRRIDDLSPGQRFSIIIMRPGDPQCLKMAPATPENKRRAQDFLQSIQPSGITNPIPALEQAFGGRPDEIELFADRDFPDDASVLDEVHKHNGSHQARIDTIALVGPDPDDHDPNMIGFLQHLAGESGGQFTPVNYTLPPAAEAATRP